MSTAPRKRKTEPATSSSAKAAKASSSVSATAAAGANGADWFADYCDPADPELIGMDGILKLCGELGLDPAADIRGLVLMWKLGANSKPGCITKSEWRAGMKSLNAFSVKDLLKLLPSLSVGNIVDVVKFRG